MNLSALAKNPTAKNLLRFENYFPFIKCLKSGKKRRVGGVALLLHETIEFEELNLPYNDEIVGIKAKIANKYVAIFIYYCPPEIRLSKLLFKFIETNYNDYLILGDFNAKIGELTSVI